MKFNIDAVLVLSWSLVDKKSLIRSPRSPSFWVTTNLIDWWWPRGKGGPQWRLRTPKRTLNPLLFYYYYKQLWVHVHVIFNVGLPPSGKIWTHFRGIFHSHRPADRTPKRHITRRLATMINNMNQMIQRAKASHKLLSLNLNKSIQPNKQRFIETSKKLKHSLTELQRTLMRKIVGRAKLLLWLSRGIECEKLMQSMFFLLHLKVRASFNQQPLDASKSPGFI